MHINPDHYLETPDGRIWTPERNAWAWQQCFAALGYALAHAGEGGVLYLLVGAQGSGKSTWARARIEGEPEAVIFDAILVKRSERAPIVALARTHGVPAVAVWFKTSLDDCLSRNAGRPPDEIADAGGLRNVFAALEPPAKTEGFAEVLTVEGSAV